jgi:hypothetical protein
MSSCTPPLFHEVQSFRVKRLRILLGIPPVLMSLLLIWQAILGHPWGKEPMSNASVAGWTVFLWLVYLRLVTVRLVTEIRPGEISVTMRGFWRQQHIPLAEITAAEVVSYDAARDWGGYGVRTTRRKAYLASGGRGVRLRLAKGGVILIGSQRPEELASAITLKVSNV